MFNRMGIFTVTDDAFHGHPEPLAAPPGVNRYALQLVYYTRDIPKYQNSGSGSGSGGRDKDKREFSRLHGGMYVGVFVSMCCSLGSYYIYTTTIYTYISTSTSVYLPSP